ncbi:MAG TPA: DPP IV N-terminal domain-containing protein, partial [Gemmatimonadales bacterium]|nr:DPP IV N-terminal domain-containing protein [Gemmatimonadales bacterium]
MHLVLAVLLAAAQQLPAQVPDTVRATVHRLFGTRDFAPQRFGPARWIEGGAAYTTVEPAAEGEGHGMDIVRYETATGARSVLVTAKQMTPAGDTAALAFDDYSWSADRGRLLLFTNTRRVWRQNTRGDYWVLDRRGGSLTKLGGDGPASTMMYAKFSPAGELVAYVRQGDLYVQRLADGAITRLTTGASATLVNGMTDWVYEEEFDLRDAFRWSPDGTRIAYWQFDMTGVGDFLLINDTDSLYPFTLPVQYPIVGTPNSAVRVGVVSAMGGNTTWIQVPGDARNNYVPWMAWAGPGQLLIQHMNRRQNVDDVLLADAATGAVRTVLSERDSAWVDLQTDVRWLEGGRRFLWSSERDGWRHVYSIARDGGDVRLVTPGAFDVEHVEGVDSAGGLLYYVASPANATERFLYRSRLDGRGEAVRVTPAGATGTHGYDVSPDGRWALHSASGADTPPTLDLVRLPAHEVVRTLVQNAQLREAAAPFLSRPTEFFSLAIEPGVTVDAYMIRPRDFDSTKTYPVLVYVYGEPAGQTVRDAWGGAAGLWYHAL